MSEQPYTAAGAVIVGNVTFGAGSSVWYNAVVRADMADITVGARTNVQDCCVLHVDTGFPLKVGADVTVGHSAILHGCTVGNNSLIGMGAIVLNGAVIGNDSIVAAGSLVPQGRVYPDGVLLMGSPARVKRQLTAEEIQSNRDNAAYYVQEAKNQLAK
ncbi:MULTISPECIES: gamma carbonic anhydrase family protein [Caproicibacterium]|uniref:Gamma carbonic anhydrase family protein n=1 Tax=Caproicibacterium argilliputei TaxID=3030016 RepID=A0AA97H2U3_9FIRM|nr:gamma carbonic anhydrase family protein [Caproicibacterium argilliputei]WOC31548.1 gamma carbonic anhydrase family protein [Caproicibacterium argilliputei]